MSTTEMPLLLLDHMPRSAWMSVPQLYELQVSPHRAQIALGLSRQVFPVSLVTQQDRSNESIGMRGRRAVEHLPLYERPKNAAEHHLIPAVCGCREFGRRHAAVL